MSIDCPLHSSFPIACQSYQTGWHKMPAAASSYHNYCKSAIVYSDLHRQQMHVQNWCTKHEKFLTGILFHQVSPFVVSCGI